MFSLILDARRPSLTPAVTSVKKKVTCNTCGDVSTGSSNYCKFLIHRQILIGVTYLFPGDYPISIINGEKEAFLVIHLILQDV